MENTMEEERGFKMLSVAPRSHQDQSQRYPKQPGSANAPSCLHYRNNLTALSQRRNYLFVAYVDVIHVFQPQLPAHIIPSKPRLILNLPKSRQGLRGYIDLTKPHAVNHLIVADLGTEEVLVAACDDGDVIAFLVRSIHIEILANRESGGADTSRTIELRTLLLSNVGESAWGLAVHKEARLLAVSSNSRLISVFAFALHKITSMEKSGDQNVLPIDALGDVFWERKSDGNLSPDDRSRNLQIILRGHLSNIPNISFCNTKADHMGKYLASTCIDGKIIIWNIWKQKIITIFQAGLENSEYRNGWGIACLDPLMYQTARSLSETFGGFFTVKWHEKARGVQYDNSSSVRTVLDTSPSHPRLTKTHADPRGALAAEAAFYYFDGSPEASDSDEDLQINLPSTSTQLPMDDGFTDDSSEDASIDSSEDASVDQMIDAPFQSDSGQPDGIAVPSFSPQSPVDPSLILQSNDDDQLNRWPEKEAHESGSLTGELSGEETPLVLTKALPFHILFTSKLDINVCSNVHVKKHDPWPLAYDSIICTRGLSQKMPLSLQALKNMERLNMILQIPELGAVAIANQVGRVMLLTMTKSAEYPCGFRIDWILPLKSQEAQDLRPEKALMGMAVGPIQGREALENYSRFDYLKQCGNELGNPLEHPRRYRLFLMYCDHTVLSYEIIRSPAANELGAQDRILLP